MSLKPGDVVLIKGDERNRGQWKIGVVVKLIEGRDGIVRAVKIESWEILPRKNYPASVSHGTVM